MSDEGQALQDSKQEDKSVKIEIELMEDGQLSVKSPILGNKIVMLGLLELAKATVFQYGANQQQIIKPRHGIMNFARRFKT